jgi:uncharacterized circularly permuted ATP-grasp superfamily protein
MNQGITFTVYSDEDQGIERIFPFDIIPKFLQKRMDRSKRNYTTIKTLIYFRDIYNEQLIVKKVSFQQHNHNLSALSSEVHGIKVPS